MDNGNHIELNMNMIHNTQNCRIFEFKQKQMIYISSKDISGGGWTYEIGEHTTDEEYISMKMVYIHVMYTCVHEYFDSIGQNCKNKAKCKQF